MHQSSFEPNNLLFFTHRTHSFKNLLCKRFSDVADVNKMVLDLTERGLRRDEREKTDAHACQPSLSVQTTNPMKDRGCSHFSF
jgi:hypothetical protein